MGTHPAAAPETALPSAIAPRGFNSIMGRGLFYLLIIEIALLPIVHMTGIEAALGKLLFALPLAAIAAYTQWRGFKPLHDAALLAMWATFCFGLVSILIQMAARTPFPLEDARLYRFDSLLGFNSYTIVRLSQSHRILDSLLSYSYKAGLPFIVAALLVPPLCHKADSAKRFVFSMIFAAFITAALFAFVPAAGPWMVDGIRPSAEQSTSQSYLSLLKSSAEVPVDYSRIAIVSFPSFHVILAILCGITFWNIRHARFFAAILTVLICISTLTTGWHYLIDVLAGLPIAFLSDHWAFKALKCVS